MYISYSLKDYIPIKDTLWEYDSLAGNIPDAEIHVLLNLSISYSQNLWPYAVVQTLDNAIQGVARDATRLQVLRWTVVVHSLISGIIRPGY